MGQILEWPTQALGVLIGKKGKDVEKLRNHIRLNIAKLTKSLVKSGLLKNNTISNSSKFVKFLVFRKYKRLNDPELLRVGDISRMLLVLGFIIFSFAFIMPIIIGKCSY